MSTRVRLKPSSAAVSEQVNQLSAYGSVRTYSSTYSHHGGPMTEDDRKPGDEPKLRVDPEALVAHG